MYNSQIQHTRQSEANFLAVDTDSNQRNLLNARGLSIRELEQRSGLDHQAKTSVRSEASVSPISFDLFGGQQQMSHHHPSMLQSLQRQQSGYNDMPQLQQQVMLRKMQELQMQQQLRQQDSRQQNLLNQNFPFAKQASGHQSSPQINGTPSSETFHHPLVADLGNANWLHHGSPTMQESLNVSPLNLGQAQRSGDLVPQLADHSLYGVPISGSRGLTVNQYSQMAMDRPSMLQTSTFSNSIPDNQLADHVCMQEGTSISRHRSQNENMLGHVSSQALNAGINMESIQPVNLIQRNAPQQDFRGRQYPSISPELSHGKPTRQYSSSQNEVALDPTEEKILFGSDDNIWAAFGKSPDISGDGGSSFDNDGLLNGFPSIQSGSWSALMQSAVAETSSSDIGPQEQWSGLVNSTEVPSANQHLSLYNESGKQDDSLADDTMRMPSAFPSGSAPPSDDSHMNNSYQNAMGFDQFGHKFQGKPGQILQSMSQRLVQPLEEANRWSNCGPVQRSVAEGSQLFKNVSQHSLDADKNSTSTSTLWNSENSGRKQPTNWKALGPLKHSIGNEGGLSLNDAASMPNSSATGVDAENSQFVQNSYLLNQWKNTNSLVKSQRGEGLGSLLHSTNEDNQVSDSAHGCDREEVTTHETDSSYLKGNLNESRPNFLQHIPSGLRDRRLSDASDSQPLPTGKQKTTNQLGRKASGPRKFQYHPMGNLDEDVESAHEMKQPTHALAMSQQNVHLGRSNFFDQVSKKSMQQSSALQRDNKGVNEGQSGVSIPGYTPNISVPFNKSVDAYTPNATSSSQNMLELLHKVDHHGSMMHVNSSETKNNDGSVDHVHRNHSAASQGFRLQLGPPSQRMQVSECSPSSQTVQHTTDSPHSSHAAAEIEENGPRIVTTSSIQSVPFSNKQSETQLKDEKSGIPGQSESGTTGYKIHGNFSPTLNSGSGYSVSHLHQQMTGASGQMPVNQNNNSYFDRSASNSTQKGSEETFLLNASCSTPHSIHVSSGGTSRQTSINDPQGRGSSDTMLARDHVPYSQPSAAPIISQHGASTQMFMWTNVPTHQQSQGSQYPKVSSHFLESTQPNIVESSSSVPHTAVDPNKNLSSKFSGIPMNSAVVSGEGQRLKESSEFQVTSVNTVPVQQMNEALGKVSSVKYPLDDSHANSSSKQKDIEAFGRSLKPNSFSHENYSLLNQVQAIKDAEVDPNIRASKRMRGSDVHQVASQGGQVNEHSAINGDLLGSYAAVSSGDSRMQRFSTSADASQDVLAFDRDTSRISLGSQISPSCLDQYGTFKNGRIFPMYDASMVTTLRTAEPCFNLGKSSSSLHTHNSMDGASLVGGAQQSSIPSSVAIEHFSSPESESKKRKDATSEQHPWHKVVSQGSQNLQTLRMAEVNWCKAANRLIDKVEDFDLIEDGLQVLRSKIRLILTTQLMQQLICPPRAAILSADASSDYESVAYSVSRIALGEACSAVSRSSDSDMPFHGKDILAAKGNQSDGIGDHRFDKAIEEFMGRATKLENEFLRLDKSASILDLRVECLDLEKFSVINRFAKFHGRGQSDSAETASTSDVKSSVHKPFLQRYVTALPMPRNIPDRVQCLSL
ncbi:uncharacterized protein LOC111374842 isoform X1 [Olea europaea var. sylvestris]|uniref:uncharacterized protein LOC111374842 isoform X1 n=1 Tax=Olea europaea var. sylvestris TaxID=158386 RepID=UPI000C1D2656|nr:uncharacterized protein LOC111374842 isoform X1 [Olea europaea var. sylvestris]XP_022853349.1 uncharacterized protein LOC111374842 isoform X1 [Olea europaea var. sylvestris]XP_022853350.1 uncharacterized protein LOC111374842 isoform X1 [Olea europaea var. sylvestris]